MSSRPKLICVSNSPIHISRMKKMAEQSNYDFGSYSEEEWATIEEIEQHIPDEGISTNVTSLPLGVRPLFSLDEMEAKIIRRTIYKVNGNAAQAARALKIGRATLYRKLDKYGFSLKQVRQAQTEYKEKILQLRQKERTDKKQLRQAQTEYKEGILQLRQKERTDKKAA